MLNDIDKPFFSFDSKEIFFYNIYRNKYLSLLDMRLTRGRVQIFVATRYATNKRSSSNLLRLCPFIMGGVFLLNYVYFVLLYNKNEGC